MKLTVSKAVWFLSKLQEIHITICLYAVFSVISEKKEKESNCLFQARFKGRSLEAIAQNKVLTLKLRYLTAMKSIIVRSDLIIKKRQKQNVGIKMLIKFCDLLTMRTFHRMLPTIN